MQSENKKWSWISLLIGLATLVVAAVYVIINRENLLEISAGLDPIWLLPMFPLVLIMLAANGFSLAVFLWLFDIRLKLIEWFSIAIATSFTNYIAPLSAGLFVRAGYLKERFSFSYTRFVVITSAGYIIAVGVTALLGLFLSLVTVLQGELPNAILVGFFLLATAASLISIVVPLKPSWFEKVPFGQKIIHALEGWQIIKHDTRLLISQAGLTLIGLLTQGAMIYFAFRASGIQVSFLRAIIMGLFLSLSTLIRLTPGNLGLQESMLGLVASLIDLSLEVGLAAGLAVRVVMIICVFTLGPVASYILTRRLQQKPPGA